MFDYVHVGLSDTVMSDVLEVVHQTKTLVGWGLLEIYTRLRSTMFYALTSLYLGAKQYKSRWVSVLAASLKTGNDAKQMWSRSKCYTQVTYTICFQPISQQYVWDHLSSKYPV